MQRHKHTLDAERSWFTSSSSRPSGHSAIFQGEGRRDDHTISSWFPQNHQRASDVCQPGSLMFWWAPRTQHTSIQRACYLFYLPGACCAPWVFSLSLPGCALTILPCNFESWVISPLLVFLLELCFSFRSSIITKPCLSGLQFHCSLQGGRMTFSLRILSPPGNKCDLCSKLWRTGAYFALCNLCWLRFKGPNNPRTGGGVCLSLEVGAGRWLPEVGQCYHLPALVCQL